MKAKQVNIKINKTKNKMIKEQNYKKIKVFILEANQYTTKKAKKVFTTILLKPSNFLQYMNQLIIQKTKKKALTIIWFHWRHLHYRNLLISLQL